MKLLRLETMLFLCTVVAGTVCGQANTPVPVPAATTANSPAVLPGNDLKQHSFLYCGEWNYPSPLQTIWLVRNGKPAWSYSIPYHVSFNGKEDFEELGDCTVLPNGNVAFSTRLGATVVSADKKVLWHRDTPPGTELHSIQPLDDHRVLIAQNGDPIRLMVIDIRNNTVEKEVDVHAGDPAKVHGQLRRSRMTAAGTFLVAHMDSGKVTEYDSRGVPVWNYATPRPWSAVRLANGNTLITGDSAAYVREVNRKGEVVWSLDRSDLPGYTLGSIQDAVRLGNGDTVFSNWVPNAVKSPADWPTTVQWIEVNPEKKVVWALREWTDPALGPASGIQILDPEFANLAGSDPGRPVISVKNLFLGSPSIFSTEGFACHNVSVSALRPPVCWCLPSWAILYSARHPRAPGRR